MKALFDSDDEEAAFDNFFSSKVDKKFLRQDKRGMMS